LFVLFGEKMNEMANVCGFPLVKYEVKQELFLFDVVIKWMSLVWTIYLKKEY